MDLSKLIDNSPRTVLVGCGILIAATAAVYSNALHGEFIFDDARVIADNESLETPARAWSEGGQRRVAMLTFALNRAVHGNDVFGYHLVNVAVHITAALLLFALVRNTLLHVEADHLQAHATLLGLAVALLWAVHPLQTQSVTYIVQRMESMMGLFALATLLFFSRGARSEVSWPWHSGAVACCALGMMTKQVMIVVPLLVLWYDRAFIATSWKEIFTRRKWAYAGLALTWFCLNWTWLPQLLGITQPTGGQAAVVVEGLAPLTYLYTQAGVIVHYLRLSVWPQGQIFDYGWPAAESLTEAAIPGALIVALLGLTVWAIFKFPRWSFLGGCFFLILAPTSSVLPIADIAVEHRMYLPLAAVIATLVLLSFLGLRWLNVHALRKPSATAGLALLTLGAAVSLGIVAHQRNRVYESRLAMWTDVVNKRPESIRARYNLATVLLEEEAYEAVIRAGREFERDFGDRDNRSDQQFVRRMMVNVGIAHNKLGNREEAVAILNKAVNRQRDGAVEHLNLGQALRETNPDLAIRHFQKAIEADPTYAKAYNNLGAMLTKTRPRQAQAYFQQALKLNPNHADAHNNLANLLARHGELDRALVHYNRALEIRPDFEFALKNRAIVLQMRNEEVGMQ